MNSGRATVQARANNILPRPDAMPEGAKLLRLEWIDEQGNSQAIDDQPGSYWYHATLGGVNFKIGSRIPEGCFITVVWG